MIKHNFNRTKAHRVLSKMFCSMLITMSIVSFAGCEKEDYGIEEEVEDAYLEVVAEQTSVDGRGGQVNIRITSNVSWIVSADVPWVQTNPKSGKNDGVVTVTISANASALRRKATISIIGGGLTKGGGFTQPGTFSWSGEESVEINGIRWATRNVDAPGTFASSPESAGKFYQWNRNVAYPVTGNVSNWDSSMSTSTTWENTNDPSPSGYRVPSYAEFKSLFDSDKVESSMTIYNGEKGFMLTDKNTAASIFFPTVGGRTPDAILKTGDEEYDLGYYWTNTLYDSSSAFSAAYSLGSDVGVALWIGAYRNCAFSVRSIKK